MKERIDPNLYNDLEKFGIDVGNWNECYHCGNCTATCPLTEKGSLFPRKEIRFLQLGLKNELATSAEPWLCYYCGDCSKKCPRDANPGELMMSLRRYLTSIYDWTGLAKRIYTSKIFEIATILVISLIVMVLYLNFTFFPSGEGAWTGNDGGVLINKIAPWKRIHFGDWLMAGTLAFFLITNIFNMWLNIIVKDKSVKVPFIAYFTEVFSVVINFFTQKRFNKCDNDNKPYWVIHLFLMLSYVMLFTMIVFFLQWFQTDSVHPVWHPQRLLGYISTIGLFVGIIYFINNRIKKAKENSKYSHYTDWTFLVMLFLTTLTGILLHFFRINGMAQATYITYLIHLMCLVPMLTIEVPFSKWSHLAYRPFAIYFANVKKSALKKQVKL
ncbi:MAG: 4Fe-4S dicluster domain-containing protein [Ignavibacteriales bacterium]|nr:4Fe-4S dicluster domain-containing protein [Ignavibacteriales bacterium]